jgi:hypothetical protein
MKANFTRIAIILDRSGSMADCRESTVAGFNAFINEQKKLPGDANVKLVQFDDLYETVFDQKLKDAPELTQATFVPRGWTALLDAQGRTIIELGSELEKMPEHERPSKVIVVTITDGIENASKEFTTGKIAAMIKHQRDNYNWDFVFLGANQDAVKVASAMNFAPSSAMSYNTSRTGVANTMAAVSNYVGASRLGHVAMFSEDDRKLAMDDDDVLNKVTGTSQK